MDESNDASFTVSLSFKGKTILLDGVTTSTTAAELHSRTRRVLFPKNSAANDNGDNEDVALKILFKGKQLSSADQNAPVFSTAPKKPPKLMVIKFTINQIQLRAIFPTI